MANITKNGNFIPYKTDTNKLPIVKCRQPQRCMRCSSKIPKGSYVLGKGGSWYWNYRTCLKCSGEFLNNLINSVEAFKEKVYAIQKELEDNKDKFEACNTTAMI